MEQGPLGLNSSPRTPPLPATHVRAGTGQRVLARNYTTDNVGPPTCEFTRYVRPRVATSWTHPTLRNGHVEDPRPAPFPLGYGQKGPPGREPSRLDERVCVTCSRQQSTVPDTTAPSQTEPTSGPHQGGNGMHPSEPEVHFPRSTAAPEGAWKTASKMNPYPPTRRRGWGRSGRSGPGRWPGG